MNAKTEDFHLRLPPMPKWPGKRYVIDVESDEDIAIRTSGPHSSMDIRVFGQVVAEYQSEQPDPIPDRVARALHVALSCCDPDSGECDDKAVRRIWEGSR